VPGAVPDVSLFELYAQLAECSRLLLDGLLGAGVFRLGRSVFVLNLLYQRRLLEEPIKIIHKNLISVLLLFHMFFLLIKFSKSTLEDLYFLYLYTVGMVKVFKSNI
jgi:hypothetical protein